MNMDAALERLVWSRAKQRCEYCRVPQSAYQTPFQIDHVIASKHGGATTSENLALSCFHCNIHKGPNIAGIDPQTGQICRLFHPRRERWADHFRLARDGLLVGVTEIGLATIAVLSMNAPEAVAVRAFLIAEGDLLANLVHRQA